MNSYSKKSAFTLIELLVVISIILIASSIIFIGGGGGDGGDRNDSAQSGDAGSPNRGAGGSPGTNGHGIIFSSSSVQSNSSGDKTLSSGNGGVIVGGVS